MRNDHATRIRLVVWGFLLFLFVLAVFYVAMVWLNSPARPDWRIPIVASALLAAILVSASRRRSRHRGRLLAFASVPLVVTGLIVFRLSWRRSGGLPAAEDLLALWPLPVLGLAILAVAFVVFVFVARHAIDDDPRAPWRRDRFD